MIHKVNHIRVRKWFHMVLRIIFSFFGLRLHVKINYGGMNGRRGVDFFMLKRCVCVTSSITRSAGWVVVVVVLVGWRKVVQTESKMPLNFIPFLNLVFLRIKCLPLPVSCLVNSSFFPSSSETTFSLAVLADTGRGKKG